MLELSFKLCFMLVQSSIICGVISLVLRDEAGFRSFYLKNTHNRQRLLQPGLIPLVLGDEAGFRSFYIYLYIIKHVTNRPRMLQPFNFPENAMQKRLQQKMLY